MIAYDDVEVYRLTFEFAGYCEDWDPWDMGQLLTQHLTGETQHAYHALPTAEVTNYELLLAEILALCGLSVKHVVARFH